MEHVLCVFEFSNVFVYLETSEDVVRSMRVTVQDSIVPQFLVT
jgi:hypothetical protein